MKKKWLFIGGIVAAFSCILASCSISSGQDDKRPAPHYLLNGTLVDSDEVFDYYDIGDNEYAVSLKSSIKEDYMGIGEPRTITIPAFHPTDTYTTEEGVQRKKVTGIWHNAFHKNKAANIEFEAPSNIETIDFEAFLYSSVTSITIPYTVNQIGDGAFYACSALTKVTFVNSNQESTGTATECECTEDCVDDEEEEEEDYIKSTLTTIPSLCFFKCNALVDLSLPASIEEICEEAFNGCSALASPLFFNNIKIIRSRAFQGCTSLLNVYISKTLFEDADNIGIEPHAFNYCDPTNLKIRFCGTQAKVTAWVYNHPNWGWYTDRENPADTSYSYVLESGDTYFTTEWQYIVDTRGEVTITKYTGAAPTHSFISFPNKLDGHTVTRIDVGVFDTSIKKVLKRIYLPTTLRAIENLMFKNDYNLLYVVDDNTACGGDYGKADNAINGRIDLSGITDLEFIGVRAFAGLGTSKLYGNKNARDYITTLHLPAKLRAVGGEAFGIFNQRCLPSVTEFIWDYSEADSILETIGTDAFYGLGISEGSTEIRGNTTDYIYNGGTILKRKWHKPSTIIFPRTFMHFGITSSDITRYKFGSYPFFFDQKSETPTKDARPAHAFIGSSLLAKVVFKGSTDSTKTCDLIIPLQTFVYTESLHTIIFEERYDHEITFHTQIGKSNKDGTGNTDFSDYAQETIGGNAGREKNDFRGEPFLQTLILPNQHTKIRLQSYAFHANSRGVIYFTGDFDEENANACNVYGDALCYNWKNEGFEDGALTKAKDWKKIGDEKFYNSKNNKRYYGYCFADDAGSQSSRQDLNTFNINQEMPVYTNIHYKDDDAEVGVGNSKQLVLQDKFAFVCEKDAQNNYVATMSKYRYTLYNEATGNQVTGDSVTTATIPETVTAKDETNTSRNYTVTKIGDSAFSSCFCDGQEFNPVKTPRSTDFDDLTTVIMPNTITSIGEYAFIRAYGVTTIKSYSGSNTPTERMPTGLRHIGKNAFLFSGIQKLLRIPYECLFYETENDVHDITSVFANAVDLREITFDNQAGDDSATASKYYQVTTYTSEAGGTRTTALYSKEYTGPSYSGETLYNANKLMLVLNRDNADNKKPSLETPSDATVNSADTGIRFKGDYKNTEFLFGAFKMGYWIKELVFGKATTDGNSNVYTQPLFSAVGARANASATLTHRYFYLGINAKSYRGNNILYEELTCDLTTIAGEVFSLPSYGLAGCENLLKTELSYKQDGVLPEGVFSEITNTDTQYITPGPEGNNPHVLDLRNTGYIAVSKDTFKKNNSIQKFIASNVADFVVGESAFDSCANLQTVDFSAVTNSLTIDRRAFANTPITNIIWPNSPCTVTVVDGDSTVGGAFESCTSLTTVSLPETLQSKIAARMFYGCTSLQTVTMTNPLSITSIGGHAFNGCSSLSTFDFSKLPNLATIGGGSFLGAGTINNNGNIELPSSVTRINDSAFSTSQIVTMTIKSSSLYLEQSIFLNCTSLQAVRFTNHSCAWTGYNASIFNGCTALTELQLPTGFNMSNTSYSGNTYFIQGDTNINIYVYEVFTTNANADEGWRRISNEVVPVHYYVQNVQQLIDANVINSDPSVLNGTTVFWTTDANGKAINLGTVVSYDGNTVTFYNGSTLTGNVFVHPNS